jgi:hypothetical protein
MRVKVSPTSGRDTYEALTESAHDDHVVALCLAVLWPHRHAVCTRIAPDCTCYVRDEGGQADAVHTAVYEPGSLVLLLSPSLRQSTELFKKCLVIYRALGRPVLAETENLLSMQLENGSRLLSLPSSETTVRGYSGVRLLICDEASRIEDALYASLRPTLAVSSGRILAMSTPHGARGWWFEAWTNGGPIWERYAVTAPDVPRISASFLQEERAVLGEWLWKQEYFGEFVSPIDAIFDSGNVDAAIRDEVEPLRLDWR